MSKFAYISLIFSVLTLTSAESSFAKNISGESAVLSQKVEAEDFDYRVQNLRRFFEKYNSPLAEYAQEFVASADRNNLDYRLIPAITGVESTFGKNIPSGSYNAYGWANGNYQFTSWEGSIAHVSETLKNKYIDRGVDSIHEIARVYAPPSKTWAKNVSFFISKIDTLPLNFDII